jgi:hypothetical protein
MRGLIWLSPPVVLGVTWGLAGIVAAVVLADRDTYPLTHFFILAHHLDLAAFNWRSGLRLVMLMLVLMAGYWAFGLALPPRRQPFARDFDPDVVARLVWQVNLVFLGVTAFWIALTALQSGGVMAFLRMVRYDAYGARDVLLENKLFTGMRLFYAALPATGCLAAGLLALGPEHGLSRRGRVLCFWVVVINLVALMILPIVMSQRLILLQYVLSVYVTACMIRGRLVALGLIPVAVLAFLATWIIHESLTNPDVRRPVADIAAAKLSFYMVNDLWNSFKPLDGVVTHTYGLFSFQFALFFTLTDGFFYGFFAERLAAVDPLRGGGEFSLFSAAYVDFGLLGGAIYLVLAGAVLRLCYHRATERLVWAAIYGQVAVALVLSVHVNFLASQDFVFSLLVIAGILWRGRVAVAGGRLQDA